MNENGRIVTDASDVAEIFNAFYGSIAGYPVNCDDGLNDVNLTEVIRKHCQHESIINIQLHMGARVTCFDFQKLWPPVYLCSLINVLNYVLFLPV